MLNKDVAVARFKRRNFSDPKEGASRHPKPALIFASHIRPLTLLVALSVGGGTARAAAEFQLERISAPELRLEPGESGIYQLRIRNTGSEVGTAQLGSDLVSRYIDDPNYSFTQSGSPACGDFSSEGGDFSTERSVFLAGPIAAGASLDCSMIVARGIDSWSDRFLTWMVRNDQGEYVNPAEAVAIGTLTNASVSTQSFGFYIDSEGLAHSTVRLEVRNAGGVPINGQTAGFCEDNFLRPFLTDGSGEGGCGDSSWYSYCFDWGYGFLIPDIEAGGSYSCLISLQSLEPYDHPLAFPIAISMGESEVGNEHSLIDTDLQNNTTYLRLEPDADVAVAATSATSAGLFALAASMTGIACVLLRRRNRYERPPLLSPK
jgi:hypothetical protein